MCVDPNENYPWLCDAGHGFGEGAKSGTRGRVRYPNQHHPVHLLESHGLDPRKL